MEADFDLQETAINTEVVKDKSKAKRRKLEREAGGAIKEKNLLPKDAFRVEHLNYKVRACISHSPALALRLACCSASCPTPRSSRR